MRRISSNIVKAGALIDDTRRFVEVWDDRQTPEENIARILDGNLLGLPSRARSRDTMTYALRPRYVDPGPEVVAGLRELRGDPVAFRDACYYETTRVDRLLADFVEGPLVDWHRQGRLTVSVDDVVTWLEQRIADGAIPGWSESLQIRVAQGFLSALRDFGVLSGPARSKRKDLAPRHPSVGGFVYVAFRLHQQGLSSRAIMTTPVWRRWFLGDPDLVELMHRAQGTGAVAFETAGSAVRIDWPVQSLAGVVRAAA